MKIMNSGRIEALNQRACDLAGIDYEDMDTTDLRYALMDSIQQVLIEENLVFMQYARDNPNPQCEVYLDLRTDELVNLWFDEDILGFDDQVEEERQ